MSMIGIDAVVGIDPGKSRGVVVLSRESEILYAGDRLDAIPPVSCVYVEGQHVRPGIATRSLMTLSFRAGVAAGYALARNCLVRTVSVADWRRAVGQEYDLPLVGAPKQVVLKRLRRYTPEELTAVDQIEAYWIARAGLWSPYCGSAVRAA